MNQSALLFEFALCLLTGYDELLVNSLDLCVLTEKCKWVLT